MMLIANPGSASRKYALYESDKCIAKLHFENVDKNIVYTFEQNGHKIGPRKAGISHLTFAAAKVLEILQDNKLAGGGQIPAVAVRIVAPSEYFQAHRILDEKSVQKLKRMAAEGFLHAGIVLQEIDIINSSIKPEKLIGISDSAFHSTMPEFAGRYAISQMLTAKNGIRRFGYHGLSAESVTGQLRTANKLSARTVICHLGSGCSVTALRDGKSVDNSMGYSPLEGIMMATRSGNIDVTAAQRLQEELSFSDEELQELLNNQSGLLGVSGKSSDIRDLLVLEKNDDGAARLALKMFVYQVQQGIGRMAAVLGGIDILVFTGTVGERSSEIRKRIVQNLHFLGLWLDARTNHQNLEHGAVTLISKDHHPARIYVVPADEDQVMVMHALKV